MRVELRKQIDKLLSEHKWSELSDYKSFFITIDTPNHMGFHEMIDGNHRLAKLKAENKINLAEIYMIDSTILSKKGLLESSEDQYLFEEFVRTNGILINSNEIEIEA